MNTSRKGWKKEHHCRAELIKQGWTIMFKSVRWRFGTLDFAGLFDVVAVKQLNLDDGFSMPKWKFISVKNTEHAGKHPQHQDAIRVYKEQYGLLGMDYELWIWHKPRWRGGGINKHFEESKWEIIKI